MSGHVRVEGSMPGDFRARQITNAAGDHITQAALCFSGGLF
jgi:hypothetical protein